MGGLSIPARVAAVVVLGSCAVASIVHAWRVVPRDHVSQTSAQTSAGDAQAAGVVAESHTIDINSAPQQEIELLPGIGPALAARVIEYRSQHGPFRGIEDLDKVRGIGPKMIEKLRPFVSFGTPGGTATTNPSPPGGSP